MCRDFDVVAAYIATLPLVTLVMYKTIFVINISIHMCLQHSNTL